MPKFRARLQTSLSMSSIKLGPERDVKKDAEPDLKCLKDNYPDHRLAAIIIPSDPGYKGEQDIIFTDGTCAK